VAVDKVKTEDGSSKSNLITDAIDFHFQILEAVDNLSPAMTEDFKQRDLNPYFYLYARALVEAGRRPSSDPDDDASNPEGAGDSAGDDAAVGDDADAWLKANAGNDDAGDDAEGEDSEKNAPAADAGFHPVPRGPKAPPRQAAFGEISHRPAGDPKHTLYRDGYKAGWKHSHEKGGKLEPEHLAALASKGQDYVAGYQQGHGIRTHMAAGVAAGEAANTKTRTLAKEERVARKQVDDLKARGYGDEHPEMRPRVAAHQAASSALEAAAAERVGAHDQLLRNVVLPHISAVEGHMPPPQDPATFKRIQDHASAWMRTYDPKRATTQQSAVHGRMRKMLSQIDMAANAADNEGKDKHNFHPADMVPHLAKNSGLLVKGKFKGLDRDDALAAGGGDPERQGDQEARDADENVERYLDPKAPTGVVGITPDHLNDIMKYRLDPRKPADFADIADGLDPDENDPNAEQPNAARVELAFNVEMGKRKDAARAKRLEAGQEAPEDRDADGKPLPMGPQTFAVAHKMGLANVQRNNPAAEAVRAARTARASRAAQTREAARRAARAAAAAAAPKPASPEVAPEQPPEALAAEVLAKPAGEAPADAQAAAPVKKARAPRKAAAPRQWLAHPDDSEEHKALKATITKRINDAQDIPGHVQLPGDEKGVNYKQLATDMLNHEKGFGGSGVLADALAKQGWVQGHNPKTLADGTVLTPVKNSSHKGRTQRIAAKVHTLLKDTGELNHPLWLKHHTEDLAALFGEILAEWLRDNIEMNDEDIEESVSEFVQQLQEAAEAKRGKDDDGDPAVKAANDEDKAAKLTTDASLDVSGDEQVESSVFDGLIEKSLFAGLVKKESMFDDLTTQPSLFDGIVAE